MENAIAFSASDFSDLSLAELMVIDGGVNWDKVVAGAVAIGAVAGIFFPPVGICAALFGGVYTITRAFDN